jgi:very-short-patch-repair endonuclease
MKRDSSSARRRRRDPEAIDFARDQRAYANEFASALWQIVRNRQCRGAKFRREYPISPYTADFCCLALKLIIEVDGQHHLTAEEREYDAIRDNFLAEQGYIVLRIPGYRVVQDAAAVRRFIESAIDQRLGLDRPSPPAPLPKQVWGEGGPKDAPPPTD